MVYFWQTRELNFLNGQFLILATEKKQKYVVFLIHCFLYSTCKLSEALIFYFIIFSLFSRPR